MLQIIILGFAALVSLLWIIGSAIYVEARIGFNNLITMNPSDLAFFITAVFIPVVMFWLIIGFIHYSSALSKQGNFLSLIMMRLKKSADENEIILKSIIESQGYFKNREVLKFVEMSIDDMNNTLADIAVRFGVIRKTSADAIWHRIGEGDKWAFCNIILENAFETAHFDDDLKRNMRKDDALTHAIKAFCSRFEETFSLLESNASNQPFVNILEGSPLGEVYTKFSKACAPDDNEINSFEEEIKTVRIAPLANEENDEEEKSNQFLPNNDDTIAKENNEISSDISAFTTPSFSEETEQKLPTAIEIEDSPLSKQKHSPSYWTERKNEILKKYGKQKNSEPAP